MLASLVRGEPPRHVLELGAGTGDISIGLAARVDRLDAVEPSSAMVGAAREAGGRATNVHWIVDTAENFRPEHPYSLAVAAESLHWMDWFIVLPKVAASLMPGAVLAIITERAIVGLPWMTALREIVSGFSTNRDYRTYDVVHEVVSRGLFKETGREVVVSERPFRQSLADYVESFHSRNGFSRDRMSTEAADAFDAEVTRLVLSHRSDGVVTGSIRATLVWGLPQISG